MMQVSKLSFENLHEHGDLFVRFLRARHDAFIGLRKWDLPSVSGMEFDQYDNPASRWVAVHNGNQVLAGIRLTPTTARCGIYSYMIRDAQLGLLPSIPTDLLYATAPVCPETWDASRIFVTRGLPAADRPKVHRLLMEGMFEAVRDEGCKELFGLVPAVWSRWIAPMGIAATPAGPVLTIDGWRTQVAHAYLETVKKRPRSMVDRAQELLNRARHLPGQVLPGLGASSAPSSSSVATR